MPRFKYVSRNVVVAALLGISTLITNALSYMVWPEQMMPVGNVFLFWSAGALGVPGALIASLTGVIPETVFTSQAIDGFRVIVLALVTGLLLDKQSKVPAFIPAVILWCLVFAPAYVFLAPTGLTTKLGLSSIFYSGVSEIVLVMISSLSLMNPALWGQLTKRSRTVTSTGVILHVVPLLSTISMLSAALLPQHGSAFVQLGGQRFTTGSLAYLFFIGTILPTFLAWTVARNLKRVCHDLYPGVLMPQGKLHGFSGLSSEYWRRKDSTDLEGEVSAQNARMASHCSIVRPAPALIDPSQGICALNRNGTVTFANRKFWELAGVVNNEVLGKNLNAVGLTPQLRDAIEKLLEDTFTKGPRVIEIKLNQLPDKLRFFEIRSQRSDAFEHSTMNDGPDSAIIMLRDITDRRTVESHLLQAQKLDSLGRFVAGLAHAFNNALTAITGQASVALMDRGEARIDRSLNAIVDTAQVAGRLVRQLLDFADGGPTTVSRLDLTKLLDDRLNLLKKVVGESYELTFEHPGEPVPVECDENLLTQALTNLLLNSREAYSQGSGKIEISLEIEQIEEDVCQLNLGARPGRFARLRVKDSGGGMSPEVLSHAFDPLFTTRSTSGHTGLGLSIAFAIVRAHDGFLTAESKLEKGTTVSIYLPLVEQVSKRNEPTPGNDKERKTESLSTLKSTSNERILVVEDEVNVRDLVSTMLTSLGYRVESCGNGEEALAVCKTTSFDLVLVDLVMPRMDGTELIAKLKTDSSGLRTLLMTGYGITADPAQEDGCIPKPFDMTTLARAVKRALSADTMSHGTTPDGGAAQTM